MATRIQMPELGESVIEGVVMEWLKQEGDDVQAGEPLVVMETEKVTTEVESPESGVLLTIVAQPGATVNVGELLAWVGTADETVPELAGNAPPPPAETAETPVSRPPTAPTNGRSRTDGQFVSPVVARMAAEHDLDLSRISGSGRNGRITKKDVLAWLETQPEPKRTPEPREKTAVAPPTPPSATTPPSPTQSADGELVPLTTMRRAIARHMVHSKQTAPHVTTVLEVDLHRVWQHREANKAEFARDGVKLTYTAYFMVAVAQMLKRHRMVNSSWRDDGIFLHNGVHIGMATDLGEKGLIVPVIKHAPDLSLRGMARTINDLAERGRAGKLRPDELQGGTFTITNYGVNGPLFATPIINQPQCAILGLGLIQRRPVARMFAGEEVVVVRPMVYLAMTFDHRILDGGTADAFLRDVIAMLENWS